MTMPNTPRFYCKKGHVSFAIVLQKKGTGIGKWRYCPICDEFFTIPGARIEVKSQDSRMKCAGCGEKSKNETCPRCGEPGIPYADSKTLRVCPDCDTGEIWNIEER